ncbi:MAG: cytochrome c, partial [Chloroflexota bacterium]
MGLTGRWRIQVGATLTGLLALTAVIGVQPARAFPPEQVTRGEAVWTAVCAECHGPDSTDLDAPLLLRPDSL